MTDENEKEKVYLEYQKDRLLRSLSRRGVQSRIVTDYYKHEDERIKKKT